MSHRKTLTSSDPKAVTALVASCDVLPQASADPATLRCKLSISFAADDARIEEAAAAYERGELTVNVRSYERAERIVADVLRSAKRSATPTTFEQAAAAGIRREREAAQRRAAEPSRFNSLQELRQTIEANDIAARLRAVVAAQRRGQDAAADENGGPEGEGE